ncbi:hypothetical protein G9A89_006743 [Geosiphon pyriformis]|nr:hypothetical protein G9A89_006743 [Geosiphon pyriformis]
MELNSEAPPEILHVVKYLRSSTAGIKLRQGVYNGKRVEYFKGKSAIKALLKESYTKLKNVPKVTDAEAASKVLQEILPHALFLRVDRANNDSTSQRNAPKILQVSHTQMFSDDQYYVWFYEGSQIWNYLGGVGLIAVVFAAVMFPLWPAILRDIVWYLAVAILCLFGVLIIISVIRLILFIITMIIAPPGIWIFPNLFEDVGFIDSFLPLWDWEVARKKEKVEEEDENLRSNGVDDLSGDSKDRRTTVQDVDDELGEEKSGDDKKDD